MTVFCGIRDSVGPQFNGLLGRCFRFAAGHRVVILSDQRERRIPFLVLSSTWSRILRRFAPQNDDVMILHVVARQCLSQNHF